MGRGHTTHSHSDRHSDRHTDTHRHTQTDRLTDTQTDTQTHRLIAKDGKKQSYSQPASQTDDRKTRLTDSVCQSDTLRTRQLRGRGKEQERDQKTA